MWTFTATDGDYAFDDVKLAAFPIHVGVRNIPIGHVFTLAEQDTLTSVTLGWADMTDNEDGITEAFDVRVEVYPLDVQNKAGECLLAYEVERPLAGGVKVMEVPARVLPAGRYFIGVRQIHPRGSMSLGCDGDQSGVFYLLDKGVAEMQDLFGYAAVRATFGQVEYVVGTDIELLGLRKPSLRGAYAANEPVVADYRNNGCEALEVEFKCTVSGSTQTKTMTVPAYGMGSVEFE
ncbi:MAG: hypothetical protein K2O01_02910, partial [Bacteroidales bacterium]|nr:hypothetical protein [Bacteroidales bacterium]